MTQEEDDYLYQCGYCCDFETDDERDFKEHVAQKHAVRETRKIGSYEFKRFASLDDMDIWAEVQTMFGRSDFMYDDCVTSGWNDPGWYHVYGRTERCGRGCCDHWVLRFQPVAAFIAELEEKAQKAMAELAAVEQAFKGELE